MRNKKRWMALLLAVCMTVVSTSAGTLGNLQVVHAESAEEQGVEWNQTAVPRYNSIRISWTAKEGKTYKILRADTENGAFTEIAANVTGAEYIDETAGTNATKYYKIVDAATNEETAVFHNEKETGFEALAETAQFKWINEGDTEFDGSTMLSFCGEEIKAVQELAAGTIIYKGYQNTTPAAETNNRVLLGLKSSSGTAYFGERSDRKGQVGIDFGTLIPGWKLAFPSPSFVGNANAKHAVGYVSPKTNPASLMCIAIDNTANTNASWTSADTGGKYGGFMKRCNITELTIGGFGTETAVTNGWNGGIDYVLITGEVLSADEVKAVTNAKPDLEPEKIAMNAKAVPGYSSIKLTWDAEEGNTYKISHSASKDGAFADIATGVSASPYVDENVEAGAKWYYKITNVTTGETTEAFANTIATGFDALKKYAAFKWINDGNTAFDGSKMLSFTGDSIEEVKDLTAGTIISKGYLTNASSAATVLLGLKNATANKTGFFGTRANKSDEWGWELSNLITNWNISFPDAHFAGTANSQHVMAYVSPKQDPSADMLLAFDGTSKTNSSWKSGSFGGFMKRCNLTELTIGGFGTPSAPTSAWNGGIDYVIITDEVLTQDEINKITRMESAGEAVVPGADIGEMFNNAYGDNSWVFTGGEDVQGGFDQVGGARNYIGQFEEYVRWKQSGNENGRQRYTINTAKKGQTLADVVTNWENRVAAYNPKAVAYMVGHEDYSQGTAGVENFKTQLKQFINKATAMRENKGFAVIQKPYATNDTATNTKIQAYCDAVDAVVTEYAQDAKYARIVVVDHFTQTKDNADFKANKLTGNKLNKLGHFEIGKQFSDATMKTTAGYPADIALMNQTVEPAAEVYSKVVPTVNAESRTLNVEIPAEAGNSRWTYTLKIDGTEIKDTVSDNTFTITSLPAGKSYTLTIRTEDGRTQLQTVEGVIEAGNAGHKKEETLNANQQKLKEKMESKKSMTWLFMGDSITHAAMWTNGYDGIAQSFEKFLKDDLGRTDDVVINTAVSGATTQSTMNTIQQRLDKYNPDVVSIMLGTNDCATSGLTPEVYKTKLKEIIAKAQAKGATVILRTPTSGNRDSQLPSYLAKMKEVADEDTSLIYVDQYTEMKQVYTLFPKVFDDFYLDYGVDPLGRNQTMGLHPGANGHIIMTRQFIEGCGLWTDDSHITNLFYEIPFTNEDNATELPLQLAPDKIGVSVKALAEATGRQIGSVKITAADGTKTYTTSTVLGEDETILTGLKGQTAYDVTVTAYLKDTLTTLTFASQRITLSDDMELNFDINLSNTKVRDLKAGAEVGTLSVSKMAPEGTYTYALCDGDDAAQNDFFTIEDNKLKAAKDLTEKQTYSIRIKAVNGEYEKEQVFEIYAVGTGFIFEEKNVTIQQGTTTALTEKDYAAELMGLEEGTFIVQYTSTSNNTIQSLFSVANGTTGNNDRHFHVYISPNGTLGYEIRNTNGEFNLGNKATNAVKPTYRGQQAKNTIAFKADKANNQYKMFANGKLVATIDASAGYKFIKDITNVNTVDIGGTIRGNSVQYPFGGTIHYVRGYAVPLSDKELIRITGETSYEDLQQIFHSGDATGSNYFRIPALLTLKDGTVVSAIDARFGGTHDSPNNIDIAFSRSEDGGKTWSDAVMPLYFDDFANDRLDFPVGFNQRVNGSASYIDPQLLQDKETGKLFLIADAMPSGIGSPQAKAGNGYKTVVENGVEKQYRMLKKAGETEYHYSIHDDNFIYDDRTAAKTEYSVNEYFEILKNGEPLTVKQKSASYDPTSGSGTILVRTTDKDVKMNIMYDTAAFTVFPTNYLYMVTSMDGGKTWSAPRDITNQVKKTTAEDRILITGPGRGLQIENGTHKGRLIVPVYKSKGCDVLYSDDHGDTWTFAEGPALEAGMNMSESQIVEMPDGSLKVFARSYERKIVMATSLDGGATWSQGEYTELQQLFGSGTQISAINYSKEIDGKPAILLSTPVGTGRNDGRVKIGLITDTGEDGYGKYSIEWRYDYEINAPAVGFGYSCMTELPNGNIGILYEQYDSYATGQLQSKDAIKYEELTIAALTGKADYSKVDEAIAKAEKLNAKHYTSESWAALQQAIEEVVRGYELAKQDEVDVMAAAIEKAITELELVPEKTGYIVTVDGTPLPDRYAYNDKVTVSIPKDDARGNCVGWMVEGVVVSNKAEYTFYVSGDITLTPIFEEEQMAPKALLTNVIATKNGTKSDIKYVAQLVIPEGYKIVKAGLIWSTKNTPFISGDDLNLSALKPTYITRISDTNQFSVTIKGVPAGFTLRGSAFAYVQKGDEPPMLIYSGEESIQTK